MTGMGDAGFELIAGSKNRIEPFRQDQGVMGEL
jgi:hypothetical protein